MRSKCALLVTAAICVGFGGLSLVAQARPAQPQPEPPSNFGSVTGHVYLPGNDAPARFAHVGLQPLEIKETPKRPPNTPPQAFTIYQTDLNGEFRIDHVQPGMYYVVVNAPGCVSPFAQFTKEELQKPSTEVARRIAAVVPVVSVRPSAAAAVTLRLARGASVAGVVRFDDGTPFPAAGVGVEKRGPDGKWVRPNATDAWATTDTEGHWAIGGLPPGEYRVQVSLSVEERHQNALLGDNDSTWSNTKTSVAVYLGDTVRERDARTVKVEDGQQLEGQDITIPVSKMHAVSGALIDARSGQALNAGHVALVYADDGKEITSVAIDGETKSFSMPFVLEGAYKLTTKDAREVRYEPVTDANNDPFHQNTKEVLLRQYGPGEMPLEVQGEMSGVNLPVEAKSAKAQ